MNITFTTSIFGGTLSITSDNPEDMGKALHSLKISKVCVGGSVNEPGKVDRAHYPLPPKVWCAQPGAVPVVGDRVVMFSKLREGCQLQPGSYGIIMESDPLYDVFKIRAGDTEGLAQRADFVVMRLV